MHSNGTRRLNWRWFPSCAIGRRLRHEHRDYRGRSEDEAAEAYWLAVVVSSLVIILSPSNLVGLPIGIWALVVLSQQEVRAAFAETRRLKPGRRGPPPTRGERTVGILALIFCLQGVPLIWLAMVRGWGWSVWSFLAVVFSVILIAFLSGFLGRKSRTGKAAIIILSLYLLVALMFLGIVVYSKAIQPLYNFGGGASVERVPAGEPTRPVATVQQPGRPWRAELPSGVTVELLGVGKDDNTSWWKPDGSPLAAPPCELTSRHSQADNGRVSRVFFANVKNRPAEPIGMTYEVTPSIYSHFTGSVKQHGKEVRNFVDFMVFDALLSGTVDTVAVRVRHQCRSLEQAFSDVVAASNLAFAQSDCPRRRLKRTLEGTYGLPRRDPGRRGDRRFPQLDG